MQMTETQAPEILKQQDEQGVAALQFTPVDDFTTFRAEYAIVDEDLVFHFFQPPEHVGAIEAKQTALEPRLNHYWMDSFPRTLDVVARDFFRAESPTLRAAYTEELKSWWLRGFGMAAVATPDARAKLFLQKLDQALDAVNVNVRAL